MPRIPVRIGQENRIKVITAFGSPDIPYLAVNATNVLGGIVTSTKLVVDGPSDFLGITTFADNVVFDQNIEVQGNSSFIGQAIFYGGTIGIGNSNTDNVQFAADVNSNFIPNLDDVFDLGSTSQRWHNIHVANINVSNLSLTGITTLQAGIGKTYGIAYFGPNAEVVSTLTPSVGIQTTNLLLTTDVNNIPVWTDSIDGGFY
jgi:hypothetical protein